MLAKGDWCGQKGYPQSVGLGIRPPVTTLHKAPTHQQMSLHSFLLSSLPCPLLPSPAVRVPRQRSIPFHDIRTMSPEAFVKLLAVDLQAVGVVAGSNYRLR